MVKKMTSKINYIAHRGLHNEIVPENSMLAFKKAIEKNIAIELDLQITKDNKVIVFHDRNLKRMTGIDKLVDECLYEELKDIKLNNSEETIPNFKDVLKLVAGKVFLDIEIKHYKLSIRLLNEVYKLLKDYKGSYSIKSFSPIIPYLFKKRNPNTQCGALVGNLDKARIPKFMKKILLELRYLPFYKPDFVAYNIDEINKEIIDKLQKYNIPLHLFTIKDKNILNKAKKISNTLIIEGIEKD